MNNLSTKKSLAVIGIDGHFANELNIDRVERAFYQGKVSAIKPLLQEHDLASLCVDSVQRLATANQLKNTEIDVILVNSKSQLGDRFLETYATTFASLCVVPNLSEALVEATSKLQAEQDSPPRVVAILGANQSTLELTNSSKATIPLDDFFEHYQTANGIAAVLLASEDFAKQQSSYIYSIIKSFASCEGKSLGKSDVSKTIASSIALANLTTDDISLLEISALTDKIQSELEITGILDAYQSQDPQCSQKLHTAISCAKSVTGEGYGFSQLAGLLKTVISLQQQYISGINDWQGPAVESIAKWQSSAFYFPTEARPWYPNSNGSSHVAAYSCMSTDSYCHLVLQENKIADKTQDVRKNGYMACSNLSLLLIAFNDQKQLLQKLEALDDHCQNNANSDKTLNVLAHTYYEQFKAEKSSAYRLALIAETTDDLIKEITLAKIGVVKSLDLQSEWKTPKGSYFTAMPVGTENNIAFFYPGIGATYVGLGRDLFHLFPEIYQPVAALADDIGATLKDTFLNPRSISALSFKELKKLDSELRNNLAHIAECGVAFACVFTKIFEEVFNVYADYSAGYSMGEVSMYAALGCWEQPGLMSARLANSETFNNRLSGELTTLRSLWKLDNTVENEHTIWETYSIRSTLAEVTEAAKDEDRVYCTIINTPDNLLIGGYPEACERVIKNLGVRSMAMDMPNAIHSSPAHANYPDMETLFTMDVTDRIKTKMFSSSCYLPIPHRSKAIANSIAKCLCDQVDFPRLVNSLHDKGARVFVEMGPGRSLCSWADKILKHGEPKSHASVPVNAKGTNDELTYNRAVAKLISHGVNVNLDTIFNGSIVVNKTN